MLSRKIKMDASITKKDDFVMDIEDDKKILKTNGFLHIIKTNSMEFCRSTSLHGLQYVGEEHRTITERLFWLLSFFISLIAVTYFIVQVWIKWNTNPVLVTFSEVATPVWEIPFPAITICPEVKVKSTVFSFSDAYYKENKTDEEKKKLEQSKIVCNNVYTIFDFEGRDVATDEDLDFIDEVALKLDEMCSRSTWGGIESDCDELFTTVLTDDGLCFSFNILASEELFRNGTVQRNQKHLNHNETLDWDLETGYRDINAKTTFPRRALTSGARSGLSMFLLIMDIEQDPICSFPIDGVKVLLHNPTDYPIVVEQHFRVPLDRDVVVGIKPRVMTTSESLRSYEPERRRCYFSSERQLRHFSIYTQQNCEMECLTNYTVSECGCAAYYMPRGQGTSICGAGKRECIQFAADSFTTDDDGLDTCNCIPACTEITYDVETSQATFKWEESMKASMKGEGLNFTMSESLKLSKVAFYYKDSQFVSSRRGELFGPLEFLASCGGLMGLYLGFSFLSLVEIIYFFTVRLCCNLRTNKKTRPTP
ncbi:pickpocket protein 28-like isoform X2 [Periplaneta americana]